MCGTVSSYPTEHFPHLLTDRTRQIPLLAVISAYNATSCMKSGVGLADVELIVDEVSQCGLLPAL